MDRMLRSVAWAEEGKFNLSLNYPIVDFDILDKRIIDLHIAGRRERERERERDVTGSVLQSIMQFPYSQSIVYAW